MWERFVVNDLIMFESVWRHRRHGVVILFLTVPVCVFVCVCAYMYVRVWREREESRLIWKEVDTCISRTDFLQRDELHYSSRKIFHF